MDHWFSRTTGRDSESPVVLFGLINHIQDIPGFFYSDGQKLKDDLKVTDTWRGRWVKPTLENSKVLQDETEHPAASNLSLLHYFTPVSCEAAPLFFPSLIKPWRLPPPHQRHFRTPGRLFFLRFLGQTTKLQNPAFPEWPQYLKPPNPATF